MVFENILNFIWNLFSDDDNMNDDWERPLRARRPNDDCLGIPPERNWTPKFDSTEYAHFGERIAVTKQEDVAKIAELDEREASPLGGRGVVFDPPLPGMSSRLFRELKVACTWANWISIAPIADDINQCLASMEGPIDTPYEGGVFWLHVEFPQLYPFRPPQMRFLTKIYHPNISSEGDICVDILGDQWSPCMALAVVLTSLNILLSQPEWNDPIEKEIAAEFKKDKAQFIRTAREWTEKYAKQKRPGLFGFDEL